LARFKKHGPGCPCCFCVCPDNETEYESFGRVRVEISGLAASYEYYNQWPGIIPAVFDITGELTGLDAINGTHIFNVEDALTGSCVSDEETTYPWVVAFTDFEVDFSELIIEYFQGDCSDDPPPAAYLNEYSVTIRLAVIKEGEHWFRVQLAWIGGTPASDIEISGCQVLACENAFDATQDGTLTDDQKTHGISYPDIEDELCSAGDIWLSPFGYSSDSESPICGTTGRVFADMEVVGTIAATTI
jgi:hypothetical protein